MQMLDVKGSREAFENTVRNYMKEKILSYDDKVSTLIQAVIVIPEKLWLVTCRNT